MAVTAPFYSAYTAPLTLGESLQDERSRNGSAEWEAIHQDVISLTSSPNHSLDQELSRNDVIAVADDIVSTTASSRNSSSSRNGATPVTQKYGGNTTGLDCCDSKEYEADWVKFGAGGFGGGGERRSRAFDADWMKTSPNPASGFAYTQPHATVKSGTNFGGNNSKNSTGTPNNVAKLGILDYFPPEIVNDRYTVPQIIGQGRYGIVARAIESKASDGQMPRQVAIKRLQPLIDRLICLRALRELRILSRLRDHANIIELIDVQFDLKYNLYLVQPYMETDLRKMLSGLAHNRQLLDMAHVKRIMYQILCALKYVHSAKVIHRDVKPENLLVNYRYSAFQVKLCDFGLARVDAFEPFDVPTLTPHVSTEWYGAPEVVMLRVWTYTRAVDIWSAGCILAELLGSTPLFACNDPRRQFATIVGILGTPNDDEIKGILSRTFIDPETRAYMERIPARQRIVWRHRFPAADPDALMLLNEMLQYKPAARPRAEQLLERSEFLSLYHDLKCEKTCWVPFNAADMKVDQLQWGPLADELKREVEGFQQQERVVPNRGANLPKQKEFYRGNNNNNNDNTMPTITNGNIIYANTNYANVTNRSYNYRGDANNGFALSNGCGGGGGGVGFGAYNSNGNGGVSGNTSAHSSKSNSPRAAIPY